jgi:chemotaxis protein CheD
MPDEPYRYAVTGTPLLFKKAYELGAEKRRLRVYIAGGAAVIDRDGLFNVGKRNHAAVRKLLWMAGVPLQGEEVGGSESRTVRLDSASGHFVISTPGKADREFSAAPTAVPHRTEMGRSA